MRVRKDLKCNMTAMKTRIFIIAAILSCLTGVNMRGQVTVQEASANVTNIYEALKYIVDNSVAPDANGVIHINVTGNVEEPEKFGDLTLNPDKKQNIFNLPSNVKKVIIASTSDTKHDIVTRAPYKSSVPTGQIFNDYFLHFAYKFGELEVKNLTFTDNQLFAWIASTSSTDSDASAKTYFHKCAFYNGYQTNEVDTSTGLGVQYLSDVYQFEDNQYYYGSYYTFHCGCALYKDNTTVIFNNNLMENFRGVSIKSNNTQKFNVTAKDNRYYHNVTFSSSASTGGGTSVTLCQVNGYLNGEYVFTGNTLLGNFAKLLTPDQSTKTCALLLQHTTIGVIDGSSFVIKDNVLQCDVFEIGYKGGTGAAFQTGSIKDEVLNHTYFISGEGTGAYTAEISNNSFVHMYEEKATQHHETDLCHVCNACGQIVLRAEVTGHGGTFQYEGEDHQMHDVNSAVHTITKNLDPSVVALGVDLSEKVTYNQTRDGLCIEAGKSKEFVITPTLPNAFKSLTFYGLGEPADVTAQAQPMGDAYYYTYTNNFDRTNLYTACPHLVASIYFGSITVTCTGLENNDCALFLVHGEGKNFCVNLSAEHPSKTISGLVPGNYTVTPHNTGSQNWQWTYTMSPSNYTTKAVAADADVEVTYSVTKKSDVNVKHGENYKDNELVAVPAPESIASWKKKGSYDL